MLVLEQRRNRRRGGAMLELAILFPFLGFLIAVGADYARIYYFTLTVTNCARNGAQYASQHWENVENADGIETMALADASNLSPPPTVTSATSSDAAGNPTVSVTVTWVFQTATRFPILPSSVEISRTVEMRIHPETPKDS